ncbi:unnamed protein product [Closterium sp. Naga37s-1]|nr:unnamed protein product [Closterium sp. Naga37s-1]
MPTVTFQVAAEESLGSASLYLTALPAAGLASRSSSSSSSSAVSSDGRAGADGVDARSVFDGVAMASLVGIVRQLAQLSDHAAAVFESLSAEVADVGRRRAAIVARVAEVEARLSRIELRTLRDTQPVRLVYAPAGSTWRFGDVTPGPVHGHGHGHGHGHDNIFQPGTRPAFLQWQYVQAGPQHAVGRAALPGYECGASHRDDTSFKRINAERGVAGSALGEEETEALALGVAEGSRAGIGRRDDTSEATGKAKGGTGGKDEGGKAEGVDGGCNQGLLTLTTREPAAHEPSPHEPSPHEPSLHEISPHTPVAHEPTPHAAQGKCDELGADESGARSGGNPVTVGGIAELATAAGELSETCQNMMVGRGAAASASAAGEMVRDDASSTDLVVENGSAGCEGTSDEEMSRETGDAGKMWDEGATDEEEAMVVGGGGLLGGRFGEWSHGEVEGGRAQRLKPWLRPDKLPLLSPSSPLSPQADEGCISPPSLALPLQAVEEEPVHASARSRSSRAHAGAGVVTGITMFRLLAKGMGVFTPRQDWTVTGGAKEPKVH